MTSKKNPRFTVIKGEAVQASDRLLNLMQDTPAPTLVFLAEQYGLRRVPGLGQDQLIRRILVNLTPGQLEQLERELVAARFGNLTVEQLLDIALQYDARRLRTSGKPRVDSISPESAVLIEGNPQRWVYTIRGHDVAVDLANRCLSCDCNHFTFISRHQALCKHLVAVFNLMPVVYAREALIDLLLSREFDAEQQSHWRFLSPRAA